MNRQTVLFVDNDATQAVGFIEQLRDRGFDVVPVELIRDALERIDKLTFDVAVLDILMPRGPLSEEETAGGMKTGLALARRIRRRSRSIPILFLTVARDAEALAWCDSNPPAGYFLKTELSYGALASEISHLASRSENESLKFLEFIFSHFSRVASALARRYGGRPPFIVEDEYDVQDLLNALLRLRFEDVRPEEWVPSYAGGRSRIDFLLKEQRICIEVKVTRGGQTEREIGEQLIIDVARYRGHPDCQILVCFICDLRGVLRNPVGLKADIEGLSSSELMVVAWLANGVMAYNPGLQRAVSPAAEA